MNAAAYLLDNGLTTDKVALLTSEGDFIYSQLEKGVLNVAAHLRSAGISKGDRVLIIADSSFFWATSYLGVILAGGVAVPMAGATKKEKLQKVIKQIEPRAAFIQDKYLGKTKHFLDDQCSILTETAPFTDNISINTAACQVAEAVDLASIMFTSGSEGDPRGVMISHRNIIANTDSILQYMKFTENDRIMAVLPFYYCYGLSLLHTHLKIGGSVVIENSFMFPEVILNRMEETGCTGFAGVPSTYQILLRHSSLRKRQLPELNYVQQAGGKLPDMYIEELLAALPGKQIFIMYGQTEATARLSYMLPHLLGEKIGSIGKGIPGVSLEIINTEGHQVRVDEVGEIVVKGDNVSPGYWMESEATQDTFRNGTLRTGDLAKIDEDGFIYIVDRAADFLKCGGYRVSSKEIEGVVFTFPGTVDVAVVSQPDEKLGEAVRIYVVHQEGPAVVKELEDHCARHLEWSFIPRKIIFVDSLPRMETGKVDKQSLKPENFDPENLNVVSNGTGG